MTGLEVLSEKLTLPHEWQLGGGGDALWAPVSPARLDYPGFVDPGAFRGEEIGPVFCLTLLDRDGRPIPMRAAERQWNPARLELKYRLPQMLITERRCVLGIDSFVSRWTINHAAPTARRFWIVLWTRRPHGIRGHSLSDVEANPQGISFQETRHQGDGGEQSWGCCLGANFDADSWSVDSTRCDGGPAEWETSPYYDLMMPGGLPGHVQSLDSPGGDIFLALAYPFELPAGERLEINFAASFASDSEQARNQLERCASMINPIQASEDSWINWLEEVPSFTCSDPMWERAYWYRWARRRLWKGAIPTDGSTPSATMMGNRAIGPLMEGAWLPSTDESSLALDQLLREDDEPLRSTALAHLAQTILSLHPDRHLLQRISRRLNALLESPCSESQVAGNVAGDTGASVEKWRLDGAREVFRYQACQLLAWVDKRNAEDWSAKANEIRERFEQRYWNEAAGIFSSTPGGCELSATGFYPLLADLVQGDRRNKVVEHAFDPAEFWTRCPIPSLGRNDHDFNPDGRWRNERVDRPFHGRSWPEITSHVIDGIGRQMEFSPPTHRAMFAELVTRVARWMFVDGDLERPACHEHYNPLTGRPALFLSLHETDGGWLIDHILRYVAGIRPDHQGTLLIDPLPFSLEWFAVEGAFVGNHEIEVHWDHRVGLTVRVDDKLAGHAPVGQSLSIALPDHWED
ncbi:MAG: hypothetical protein U1D30_14245 [Planctomycetota bacterium]